MSRLPSILIVDDEKNTRDGLRASLGEEFEVLVASDAEGALALLECERIDVLLTDLRLGGDDGMQLLSSALVAKTPPVCIMMTAYGSVDTAVEAMRRGAYDFVTKPVNLERLEILIRRALGERRMQAENEKLRRRVESGRGLGKMIGQSAPMARIFETIRQVAPSRATVLIEGESGTGKEVAALCLHELSNRSSKKFVAVHCAALSPQLLESELFGHEKGSFTGAFERRIGRFEQADGGTLFLDEIGEIDAATQVKILRVLGERSFERVGGRETLHADTRLLAATNRSLDKLVAEGKFREDLFFRLNVVRITMPPLRDRREDIPLLAHSFLKQSSEDNEKPPREFSPEAMRALLDYSWPGNVRELRAAVEHGVVMATGSKIGIGDLPSSVRGESSLRLPLPEGSDDSRPQPPGKFLNLDRNERSLILQALDSTSGNRTEAAKLLGISRRTLHRRIRDLHLD